MTAPRAVAFSCRRRPRRNQTRAVIAPGVHDDEDPTEGVHANRDESFLVFAVVSYGDRPLVSSTAPVYAHVCTASTRTLAACARRARRTTMASSRAALNRKNLPMGSRQRYARFTGVCHSPPCSIGPHAPPP